MDLQCPSSQGGRGGGRLLFAASSAVEVRASFAAVSSTERWFSATPHTLETPCFDTWHPDILQKYTAVEIQDPISTAPNLPTKIVGFRGLDSSIILILRAGILRPIGNFLESLSQAMLVGGLGVNRLLRSIFKLRVSKFGVWAKQILTSRRWAFLAHRLIS